jgi:hypothetical protein
MTFRKNRSQFLKDFGISINMPGKFHKNNVLGYLMWTTRLYPKENYEYYFVTFEHAAFPVDTKLVSFNLAFPE